MILDVPKLCQTEQKTGLKNRLNSLFIYFRLLDVLFYIFAAIATILGMCLAILANQVYAEMHAIMFFESFNT